MPWGAGDDPQVPAVTSLLGELRRPVIYQFKQKPGWGMGSPPLWVIMLLRVFFTGLKDLLGVPPPSFTVIYSKGLQLLILQ